jgi:RNA polymerase sigma-70 factor (ECF subfamily)
MEGFRRAVASGDVAGLAALFSSDATLYSDGGGKATATINPVHGAEKIARFFIGVRDKQPEGSEVVPRIVNGSLGYVIYVGNRPIQASHFEFDGDRIAEVHIVRNPDKLTHLLRG